MIDQYLTQTATLMRPTALAADGSRTYESSSITCRMEPKNRLVTNAKGEEVTSKARLFTTTKVNIGDVILHGGREWPVVAVFERWSMSAISHYEVYF